MSIEAETGRGKTDRAPDNSTGFSDIFWGAEERPSRIGPYGILGLLGEGGFGIVYSAEQESPIHRQVALKVLKLGMDTKAIFVRFEVERQALALTDHPGIAKVYDAGAASLLELETSEITAFVVWVVLTYWGRTILKNAHVCAEEIANVYRAGRRSRGCREVENRGG